MTRTALALIAAAGLCLTAADHALASTLNFASIDTFSNEDAQGTLDGVGFTIDFFNATSTGNTTIDLSTGVFDNAGSANQGAVTYANGTTFVIDFDQAIDDFALYLNDFKIGNVPQFSGVYNFDSGQGLGLTDFTLNENFVNGVKTQDYQLTVSGSGGSGILSFSDPVTTLTVFGGDRVNLPQSFTFSGVAAVPEPTSIAFLATGGLAVGVVAAVRRRRRMCRSAGCRR